MDRRTYIYWAFPLFVLLSCGHMLCTALGELGGFIVGVVAILVAWGVVWLRLYSSKLMRPEFAVLSVLPFALYFICRYMGSALFQESPVWQNLYALTWLGFVIVGLISMRRGAMEISQAKDSTYYFLVPLILIYSAFTFFQYYNTLTLI